MPRTSDRILTVCLQFNTHQAHQRSAPQTITEGGFVQRHRARHDLQIALAFPATGVAVSYSIGCSMYTRDTWCVSVTHLHTDEHFQYLTVPLLRWYIHADIHVSDCVLSTIQNAFIQVRPKSQNLLASKLELIPTIAAGVCWWCSHLPNVHSPPSSAG